MQKISDGKDARNWKEFARDKKQIAIRQHIFPSFSHSLDSFSSFFFNFIDISFLLPPFSSFFPRHIIGLIFFLPLSFSTSSTKNIFYLSIVGGPTRAIPLHRALHNL